MEDRGRIEGEKKEKKSQEISRGKDRTANKRSRNVKKGQIKSEEGQAKNEEGRRRQALNKENST